MRADRCVTTENHDVDAPSGRRSRHRTLATGGAKSRLSVNYAFSCTPSQVTATLPSVSWLKTAVACQAPASSGGTCGSGAVCSPIPTAPFNVTQCITAIGALECPAGPYTQRHIDYSGIVDNRSCTACACGAPAGATCTGESWEVFGGPGNCAGPTTTFVGPCVLLSSSDGTTASFIPGTPTGTATCPASGGAPIGSAAVGEAETVCCIPSNDAGT